MKIVLIGLNHKHASVELREKMAFPVGALNEPLKKMIDFPGISEGFILSTCNRVEVLAAGGEVEEIERGIKSFISEFHQIPFDEFEDHLYMHSANSAVHHLFRVSSSLDSMVVGEPQILGQLKDAYREATESNSCGTILNKLINHAFRVAKRVRTETEIGSSAVSVSYAAVELAKRIYENLHEKTVMLIGAGEMAELAAQHFVNQRVKKLLITNRTFERAETLAKAYEGTPIRFDAFQRSMTDSDIVLCSTGSPEPILDTEDIRRTMKIRKNRPMFLIDIAVPRDVDPKVNGLPNVYLYDVDDLQGVVEDNLAQRKNEASKAELMVEEEVESFQRWMQSLEVAPTIKQLRNTMDEIRKAELEKALSVLKDLSKKEQKTLEAMSSAIVNKILHYPITLLKEETTVNGERPYAKVVRKLFRLDENER
jgi:glutamyl-tRNA reductase